MDSDEDEEFIFEEDLDIQQRPDRHGWKLDQILSEVETKIPSLEFDDDENEDDAYVWTPPDNVPVFYKQFTSNDESASLENQNKEILETVVSCSSVSCQTHNDMLVSQHGISSSLALEDKPTTVINVLDKKPITTLQSSSSMYLSYHGRSDSLHLEDAFFVSDKTGNSVDVSYLSKFPLQVDSNSQIYENDIPITASDGNVSTPNSEKIVTNLSLPLIDSKSLVDEQKFPVEKVSEKGVSLEVCVPSVSTQSLACQTDDDPSVYQHHLSTTSNKQNSTCTSHLLPSTMCFANNNSTFHQHYLRMSSSSKTMFNPSFPNYGYSSVSLPSSVSCQTTYNYNSTNETTDEAMQINDKERNIGTAEVMKVLDSSGEVDKRSHRIKNTEHKGQLDFNVLSKINFNELQSVLGSNSSEYVLSYLLPSGSQQDEQSVHKSDAELMVKLSGLSKDQLNACSTMRDTRDREDITAESMYQKQRKVKGNRGSAKAIHSWSQLSSDDTPTQEPPTIFLDLRPMATMEKEKEENKHSESIQRILGLNNRERSGSFSDSGSDDELVEWREMRTKFKERAKQEPENHKKSTNTHACQLTRKPIGRTEKAPLLHPNQKPTMELHGEELTDGLPFNSCGIVRLSKELDSSAGNTRILKKSSAKVQDALKESTCLNSNGDDFLTQNIHVTTSKADAETFLASETAKHFQNDGCVAEAKNKGTSEVKTKDKSFVDMDVNRDEIKAQNYDDGHVKFTHKANTSSDIPTAQNAIDVCDSTVTENKVIHKENGKYPSSSDNFQHENKDKENTAVDFLVQNNCVNNEQCGEEKQVDKTSYNAFHSKDKVQSREKVVPCNEKSEEKQITDQETTALNVRDMATSLLDNVKSNIEQPNQKSATNIRISLRLSGTEEEGNKLKDPTRNVSMRARELSMGLKQEPSISNDILEIDMRDVNIIMEHMKEEKSKQSLNTKSRTPTPNSGDKTKQTTTNNVDTGSSSFLKTTKPHKTRSQKEMKKLKEKLRVNIQSMRPSITTSGKFPTAYNTPIIYDQEASFEDQQQGLLSTTDDNLSLLLVLTLSGCCEINHQYSKGRNLGSGSEVNHYFALLSWLLCHCDPYNSDSNVPFTVVGMQQAYQNGLLQLFVAVEPNEKVFDPNSTSRKGSKKNKTRAFHKAISKYLSTHSLSVYLKIDECPHSSKMLSSCIAVGQDSNAVRRVFKSKPGFYWETIEMDGGNDTFQSSCCDINVENTVVFVRAPLYYHDPSLVLHLLTCIENEGCDVAGLRLINENNSSASACCNGEHETLQSRYDNFKPRHTLALAVRGPFAISKMKKIIGSKISLLDNPREVPSHRSLYCPSYSNQAVSQLARVFGGRLTEDDIVAIEEYSSKSKPCSPNSFPAQKPPTFLVSSTRVAFYLIISPLVPSSFLGEILNICFLRGFVLHGVRKVQLNKRQSAYLGLSQLQFSVFCPFSGNTPFQSPSESPPSSPVGGKTNFSLEATFALTKTNRPYPSTILVLQKENGLYHAASLVKRLFESLKEWMTSNSDFPVFGESASKMYLTITQFNEANSKLLWGDVCYKPDVSLLKHARNNRFSLNCEIEQVCVLSSSNREAIQNVGILLKMLYSDSNPIAGNWELIGIKSFPSLSLIQAKEVTPYEIGDRSWLSSLKHLMSVAVFVFVFRGINIIQRLRDFFTSLAKMSTKECGIRGCMHEDWWISQTAEVAYRQLTVLFEEQELFSDETNRTNTMFVPPLRQRLLPISTQKESKLTPRKKHRKRSRVDHKACLTDDSSSSIETAQFGEVSIIQSLLVGPRPLPTVALIKPRVVSTKKMGKIFKSILQENFDIVALSMRVLTQSEAQVLLRDDEADYNDHMQYLTSGPSLLICLQRENAVKKLLDLLGPDDPIIARSLDLFLLRGCFGVDSIHNAIHGSESYSSAICELKMLFPCGVCGELTVDLEAEQIPCRVVDATIGKKSERKLTKQFTQMTGIANSLISSLVQVNCLILTHHIVYGRSERKRIALVEVLDCLLATNFVPVGMKMAMLSREQVDEFLMLIGLEAKRKQYLEFELTEGPCVILALQRDNAITCFDSIIESVEGKRRSIIEHCKYIIHAQTEEEARNLLMYFFDGLAPNSVQQICPI